MKKTLTLIALSLALLTACDETPNSQSTVSSNAPAKTQNSVLSNEKPKSNPAEAVKFSAEKTTLKAGAAGEAVLKLRITEPFHVNSNPPSEKSYIPLEVKFDAQNGVSAEKPTYPQGELKKFAFSEDQPLSVYEGEIAVKVPLKAAPTAAKGEQTLNGKLSFQACDNEVCYRPQTVSIQLPVVVN